MVDHLEFQCDNLAGVDVGSLEYRAYLVMGK